MAEMMAYESLKMMMDYGVDPASRRIIFHADMETKEPDENCVSRAIKSLIFLDKTEGPIELWINSPGGYLIEMFGLYDAITTRRNKIITIGFGEIASAAGLILACGDERRVTENAFFMAHESAAELDGPKSLVDLQLKQWEREHNQWASLMAKHTKHTRNWWLKTWKEKKELWFNSKEMVRHGIADSIIPPSSQ